MKIGIITEEVTNEDVSIALSEAGVKLGCEIIVIDQRECTIHNFAKPSIQYKGQELPKLDACIVRGSLKNYSFRLYLSEYLEKQGVVMFNDSKAFDLCNDKFKTQTILNELGIKTPNTVSFVNLEQLEIASKALDDKYPMVIKTVSGSHGVGVIKVDTFESLKSIVQLLLATNTELMLQEFIPHTESGRLMTVGDNVIASVMRTIPEGDFRSNLSQGAQLKPHSASDVEKETAIKVAKALGCKISAIDYILSPNGDMVIFEANSSPGFKSIQEVNKEINVAEEVLKYILTSLGAEIAPVDPNQIINVVPQDQSSDVPDVAQDVPTSTDEEEEEEEHKHKKKHTKHPHIQMIVPIAMPVVSVPTPIDPDSDGDNDSGEVETDEEEDEEEHSIPDEHVGLCESVIIKRINNDKPFEAKVDTGADRCSLGAEDIEVSDEGYVRFTIDGTRYKIASDKTVKVVAANGAESRPIVKFNVEFNGKSFDGVDFNIASREGMKYQVIVGKNLLSMADVMVNPQK